MHYGKVEVSMPKTHVPGTLEAPSRWRREKADPNRHILVMTLDVMEQGEFIASANQSLADAEQDEAPVYIHGYNFFAVHCASRLKLRPISGLRIPITYSWPSYTKTLRYLGDEANVKHGQPFFDEFLQMIVKELNVKKIHLLAHSMGNRLLTQGMASLSEEAADGKLSNHLCLTRCGQRGV